MAGTDQLTKAFVELADTLVDHYDVVDFMTTLAAHCVEILGVSEVGIILADAQGTLRVVASSSERLHVMGLLQLQSAEGPALDAYKSGKPVINQPITLERWPLFAEQATALGLSRVHALPMRLRAQTIGAVTIFSVNGPQLDEQQIRIAQGFADIATIGILQERAVHEARVIADQLQIALDTRVLIEQAKGVLAERTGVTMDEAFALLRGYARDHRSLLSEVSRGVVTAGLVIVPRGRPESPDSARPPRRSSSAD